MLKPKEILELRRHKGLSQRDLATQMSKILSVEMSFTAVSKWENGKSKPSPAYLKALEEILKYKDDHGLYSSIIRDKLGIDDSRNISGKWFAEWSYEENKKIITNPNYLDIEHNGDIIKGKSVSKNFEYEIVGYLLSDSIISGQWYSVLKESLHHGVFMLNLYRNGKKGIGKWIGTYDEDNKNFKCGNWIWEKK